MIAGEEVLQFPTFGTACGITQYLARWNSILRLQRALRQYIVRETTKIVPDGRLLASSRYKGFPHSRIRARRAEAPEDQP